VEKYLGNDECFLLTYGDGVGDINIPLSIDQHKKNGKICTMTAVHPPGRFGELGVDSDLTIHGFNEKPQAEGGYINGGYMVCHRDIFKYLPDDSRMMLEQEPMRRLTEDRQLEAFPHDGFWQPMDTYQEFTLLNQQWENGTAPWKVW
jgi:glucose-1-phosphate cytidylyltransferase